MYKKANKLISIGKDIYNYNIAYRYKTLAPTAVQINITYKCNSRCQMCQIWKMKPRDEFSFAEWKKVLDDPIFLSIKRLLVAGGEPFLHPELSKLCRLFVSSMPQLQSLDLVTNGFLPEKTVQTMKQLINLCQKKGIGLSVSVSLDAIGKQQAELRGIPNAFAKTSATILALRALQNKYCFGLSVGGVICRKNLHQIKKVEQWCRENKTPFNYQIIGFHETYVQNLDKKEKLDFAKEDRKYLYALLEKLSLNKNLKDLRSFLKAYYWKDILRMYKDKAPRTTPCPFTADAFVLDSLGDIYWCLSERKIGNCRNEKTVSEIYYDKNNLAFRRQMTKSSCLKCNSGCFASSAIAKDFKKLVWFCLTGDCWPAERCHQKHSRKD